MSMSWAEHVKQAEAGLREAEQDLAIAQTQNEYRRAEIAVQIAIGHALLANAKRITT